MLEKYKGKYKESKRIYYIKNRNKLLSWQRDYYKNNKEEVTSNIRNWINNNREKFNASMRKNYWKNKHKQQARGIAIWKIKIPKGKLCESCNTNLAIERHHKDYSKPLDVVLLCKKCHTERYK